MTDFVHLGGQDTPQHEPRVRDAELLSMGILLPELLDSVPIGLAWKDRLGRFMRCNLLFSRLSGLEKPGMLTGKDDYALPCLTRDQAARSIDEDQQVMTSDEPRQGIIIQIPETEGSSLWIEISKHPIHDASGSVIGLLVVWEDISARLSAEQRQEEELDMMTHLYQIGRLFVTEGQLAPILGTVVETAMAICHADFGNIQLLDPDTGDLRIVAHRGFPQWWLDYWDNVSAGRGCCGTALEKGQRFIIGDVTTSPVFIGTPDLDIQLKAGVRAVQSTPLVSRSGKRLGMFSTHYRTAQEPDARAIRLLDLLAAQIADIIDRAQIEEALRSNEELFRIAQSCAQVVVWEWDLVRDEIKSVNEQEQLFVFGRSRWTGSYAQFLECVHPADIQKVERIRFETMEAEQPFDFDFRILLPSSEVRWLNVKGSVRLGDDGSPRSLLGITADITEKKRMEREREELQQQLQQSQKMDLLGQLAGGIAHDVNNVLAAIQGNAELLLRDVGQSDPHYKNLTSIIHAVNRSAEMVRHLLAFSRKQPVRIREIAIDNELEKIYLLLRKLIRENIRLEWKLNAPDAHVNLDPSSLVQIMTNLVVNARDAIAESGTILVQTMIIGQRDAAPGSNVGLKDAVPQVRISVADDGVGIDSQTLPHIFEPFFTTKGIGKGSGLGLSMVYGLMKQNNGQIFCHSEVGRGTTFVMNFPVVLADGTAGTKLPDTHQGRAGHQGGILVVEDEDEITSIIKMILEQQGFFVQVADNAEKALALIDTCSEQIRLVISDIMLPGMNGVRMSQIMSKKHPEMKFLFMSGYSADVLGDFGAPRKKVI